MTKPIVRPWAIAVAAILALASASAMMSSGVMFTITSRSFLAWMFNPEIV